MASCSGTRYWGGIATSCGSRSMSWQNSGTANLVNFYHNTSNASTANISFNGSFYFQWWDGGWINPNGYLDGTLYFKSSQENWTPKMRTPLSRWNGCLTYTTRSGSGSFVGVISASDSSVRVGTYNNTDPNFSPAESDMQTGGECIMTIGLPTTHRILPPKGIAAQISHFTQTTLDCSSSITSWSDNPNIVGTPYTQGGGRTWNFMAEIKTAQSTSSTTLKRIEKNTGETKNATFNFTGLDLAQGTTYYVRYVVSNDYQQIIETWNSFTTPKVGPLTLTINNYNTREVNFTASVPSIESTEATWTFRLKDVNNAVIATKSVTNANTTQNNFFKNVELKLGKDYFIEAECKNKEGFSASASAAFHMWLGWVVWDNGTKKRIGRMTQTTTSGTKEIVKMSTRGGGTGPITAYEYDELEYSAIDYDNKNMTAEDYDINAKAYLT